MAGTVREVNVYPILIGLALVTLLGALAGIRLAADVTGAEAGIEPVTGRAVEFQKQLLRPIGSKAELHAWSIVAQEQAPLLLFSKRGVLEPEVEIGKPHGRQKSSWSGLLVGMRSPMSVTMARSSRIAAS